MSADAWRQCPRCLKKFAKEVEQERRKASASYGKVPAEEWSATTLAVETKAKRGLEEDTFREDYEICTGTTGKLIVSYHGKCTVAKCGYTVKFQIEEMHAP